MMKKYLMLFLVLLPLVQPYYIDMTINSNDIVSEKITIQKPIIYDTYEFQLSSEPISIIYEGNYEIRDGMIIFHENGKETLEFELIYDGMIERSFTKRVFRASFDGSNTIKVILPEKFMLSKEPNAIPKFDAISTDGQKIMIRWDDASSIAVFYEGGVNYISIVILVLMLVLIASSIAYLHLKRQKAKTIDELISEDEKLVISEVKKGVIKQREISRNLDFSKSKLSKVIRKLEEKNLIEKKPHFKTNIIKIKK